MIAATAILVFITVWNLFKGNWGWGVASCLFTGFAYWTLQRTGWDNTELYMVPIAFGFAAVASVLYGIPKRRENLRKAARMCRSQR